MQARWDKFVNLSYLTGHELKMEFALCALRLHSPRELRAEIERIGGEETLRREQLAKGTFHTLKLEGIAPRLARFLYQELVLEGGQVVLPARLETRTEPVAVLLFGTQYQLQHLVVRLRTQSDDELAWLADELESVLENQNDPTLF